MANNFLIFNPSGNNELSQASYAASSTRTGGLVTGIAVKELHNKLFKQVSMMVSALGELINDYGLDADDSNFTALKNAVKSAFLSIDRIMSPVANLAALKAINTTLLPQGVIINCNTLGTFYLDQNSTATPNDVTVVQPTVGTGRWLISGANTFAPLASPAFTGNPTATTPAISDNDTSLATTAYVRSQIVKGQVTVTNASWVASGNAKFPFKKNVAITDVVAADKPINFDFTLATYEIAEAAGITYLECYAGGVTLYAAATPTGSVTADYVIRKA